VLTRERLLAWVRELRWLKPGLGVKRWILLILAGAGLFYMSIAFLWLRYSPVTSTRLAERPFPLTVFIGLAGGGALLVALGLWGLYQAWTMVLRRSLGDQKAWPEALVRYRQLGRGPYVVAIGGGHGLSNLLRGLKFYTSNLTAIVTVADDGGSSGRLRRELGILPPGDFRNCIAALADDEALLTRLFQYRFSTGVGLQGHSFGNLFLSAMTEITGSFDAALVEGGRLLGIQGRVLPSTMQPLTLVANLQNGHGLVRQRGESQVPQPGQRIVHLEVEPEAPPAYPEAVRAILEADLVVLGPGSLFTSVVPNLLVPGLVQALQATPAPVVYVCNVVMQPGETEGFTARDHLEVIERYLGPNVLKAVVLNDTFPEGVEAAWVVPNIPPRVGLWIEHTDLVDREHPARHDSRKLAQVLMRLIALR